MTIPPNLGHTVALADAATPAEIVAILRCTQALTLCSEELIYDAVTGEAYETLVNRLCALHKDLRALSDLGQQLVAEVA